jgi:cytochrome P450 monooxygenase
MSPDATPCPLSRTLDKLRQGAQMTVAEELPTLRYEHPSIGRLSPQLRSLRERGPVTKVRTPAGSEAWLVTRYAEMKQLLLDDRLIRTHPNPAEGPRYADNPLLDIMMARGKPADFQADHARDRGALNPLFSARRMMRLQPAMEQHVEDALDKIVTVGPPVDLHAEFSEPVTFQVLYHLLGIPAGETHQYLELYRQVADLVDRQNADRGLRELFDYLHDLVARKRADPDDNVISALAELGVPDQGIAGLVLMLSGGHGTTSSNINMGILLFAANPDQRRRLIDDPSLMPTAVEEVVRMAKTGESFVPRYTHYDIEIGGVTIKGGDLVLTDHTLANYDDLVFADAETFDVGRHPNPHLGFSWGSWHCIGTSLARIELETAFSGILRRLPELYLTVPLEQIKAGGHRLASGVEEMPVTW